TRARLSPGAGQAMPAACSGAGLGPGLLDALGALPAIRVLLLAAPTFDQQAAIKKCKRKFKGNAKRKKCINKAKPQA
ncbi:MAG TPA: hypothetical protein VFL56_02490, partial [Solirubrobacterales bacterium]|nr:hypothetical protein [Solirubrobacterales bacterium]